MRAKQLIYLLMSVLVLQGCLSEKKMAEKCAELYPVRDSIIVKERTQTDTVLLAPYEIVLEDTTICPPAIEPDTIVKTITRWRKGQTVTIERVVRDTLRMQENTSEIRILEIQNDELRKELQAKERQLAKKDKRVGRSWFWAFWSMVIFTVLILLVRRKR